MKRRGFTLVQLLIALAITAILIAIVVSVGGSRPEPVARATKAEMKVLDALMQVYEAEGNVPITAADNKDPATTWVKALMNCPKTATGIRSLKQSGSGADTKVVDSFGTPIEFVPADPTQGKPAFFRSAGPDGQMGTADDLFSGP